MKRTAANAPYPISKAGEGGDPVSNDWEQVVWVMATRRSVASFAKVMRQRFEFLPAQSLLIAAQAAGGRFDSYKAFVAYVATQSHPYLMFTTPSLWRKRLQELVGSQLSDVPDHDLLEWFWTLYGDVAKSGGRWR